MFLIILIILLSIKTPLSSNLHCSFDNIHTTYKDNDLRIIQNFDNLDELKFNYSKPIKMSILGLKPKKQIILDKRLNLTGLKIQPNQDNFTIMLENFKGFNLKSNPFEDINFTSSVAKLWSISFSNFEFYEKEKRIENICDEHLLKEIMPKNQFNSFLLTLDSDTKFSENTCPIIFWNIHLRILNIRQISFSLIEKNILGFKELSRNISKAMNSTIWLFKVGLYHTDLNSKLLNEFVFSKLTVLLIFVRKKMHKKEELTTMSTFVASLNQVVLASVRIKNNNDTKKRINKLKNRITTMIILNGLNFLVLRFPLALLSFYGFIFRFDNQEYQHKPNTYLYIICRYYKFCTSLEEIFYFIYLNSYIIQFFIFLKLDKNIKESFGDLVMRGKKC